MKIPILKYACVTFLLLCLNGCGDVEWFPEQSATDTQTESSNQANAVLDSTGTAKATNLVVQQLSTGLTIVTVSIKVDVTNLTSSEGIQVEVAGKDANGLEIDHTFLSGQVNQAETVTLTTTLPIDIELYPKIKSWNIKAVTRV